MDVGGGDLVPETVALGLGVRIGDLVTVADGRGVGEGDGSVYTTFSVK